MPQHGLAHRCDDTLQFEGEAQQAHLHRDIEIRDVDLWLPGSPALWQSLHIGCKHLFLAGAFGARLRQMSHTYSCT